MWNLSSRNRSIRAHSWASTRKKAPKNFNSPALQLEIRPAIFSASSSYNQQHPQLSLKQMRLILNWAPPKLQLQKSSVSKALDLKSFFLRNLQTLIVQFHGISSWYIIITIINHLFWKRWLIIYNLIYIIYIIVSRSLIQNKQTINGV